MAGRARRLSAVRRLPRHRQPADQQLGGIRDAARDGRVAASFASVGRQTDTSLGVAISGAIVEPALARGAAAFTGAEHAVWWLVLGLGAGILVLGLLSTGRWALGTAALAAALFEEVDHGPRTARPPRAEALGRR
jgi:hypothetical protein